MESMQLVPICSAVAHFFYVVVWVFFSPRWVKLRMRFHEWLWSEGAGLVCSQPHTTDSHQHPCCQLLRLSDLSAIPFTLSSRQKTIWFLGAGLVLCWLKERAWFTEGSGKHWRQQECASGSKEGSIGAGCPFRGSLQLEPWANAR